MSSDFDNSSKPVDRNRPFHRINSDNFAPDRERVSGLGWRCGCRGKENYVLADGKFDDFSADAARQLMVTVPAWVSVEREIEGFKKPWPGRPWPKVPEVEREVEGQLLYSQQTNEDFPWSQWHYWYDWNFFIIPAKGYEYVRGRGTHENEADRIRAGTIECEWDCGAFGDYDFDTKGGRTPTLQKPGPMFGHDWVWPVGGEYIWLAGRWIYDCGHVDTETLLTNSELHPCKAIATARWEAVKFDEHEHPVPAIQFMFFANSFGGYRKIEGGIGDKDYEFIVDLPELPDHLAQAAEYPIGQSPDDPLNTLVIRPRLLVKLDFDTFLNARGPVAKRGEADPKIELMPTENPDELPQQAKVLIPLTELDPDEKEEAKSSYGVVISLGWYNPLPTQAEKVKLVRVIFDSVDFTDKEDFEDRFEEFTDPESLFQFKFGVNGRWHARVVAPDVQLNWRVHGSNVMELDQEVTFYLAEDDDIRITCHGMEEDVSGRILRQPRNERVLEKARGDGNYDYEIDLDQPDDEYASQISDALVSDAARRLFLDGDYAPQVSDPMGRIVPGIDSKVSGDTQNPLKVSELMRLTGGPGRTFHGQLTAREALLTHLPPKPPSDPPSPPPGVHWGELGRKQARERWEKEKERYKKIIKRSKAQYALRYRIEYQDLPT